MTAITFQSESSDYYMVISLAKDLLHLIRDIECEIGEEWESCNYVIGKSTIFTEQELSCI